MVTDIVVRCDDYLTKIIQTRPLHVEQKIIPLKEGGCEIHVDEMTKFRLVTWVMHQCGRAEILKPASLRKDVLGFSDILISLHSKEIGNE